MFLVIIFEEAADNHSPATAGMDELPVLEVNAYMGSFLAGSVAVEEDQVAFAQFVDCQ